MKLKKASIYLLGFLMLCAMFCICYYLSYLHALNNFNARAIEQKQQLYALAKENVPTKTPAKQDDSVATSKNDITVLPTTKYNLEIYDMKTETTQTQVQNPPADMVGLTREEVINYLTGYMSDMPLSEYNKGLIAYELVSFSKDEITIKKTYNEDCVPGRYYVAVKNGYVVVYNSDLKSIFKYTSIEANSLAEEDRIALSKGIYVNSQDELYALLESYSS